MKRLLVLGVLAAGGFLALRAFRSSAAPVKRYEEFAEHVLNRRYDAAAAMCDGVSREQLEQSGTMEKIGAGASMFQTVFASGFAIRSKETNPDGTVTLTAIQTVRWNPPGVESVMRPAMAATMDQVVTLRKTAGAWKVTAFRNAFRAMDAGRGGP